MRRCSTVIALMTSVCLLFVMIVSADDETKSGDANGPEAVYLVPFLLNSATIGTLDEDESSNTARLQIAQFEVCHCGASPLYFGWDVVMGSVDEATAMDVFIDALRVAGALTSGLGVGPFRIGGVFGVTADILERQQQGPSLPNVGIPPVRAKIQDAIGDPDDLVVSSSNNPYSGVPVWLNVPTEGPGPGGALESVPIYGTHTGTHVLGREDAPVCKVFDYEQQRPATQKMTIEIRDTRGLDHVQSQNDIMQQVGNLQGAALEEYIAQQRSYVKFDVTITDLGPCSGQCCADGRSPCRRYAVVVEFNEAHAGWGTGSADTIGGVLQFRTLCEKQDTSSQTAIEPRVPSEGQDPTLARLPVGVSTSILTSQPEGEGCMTLRQLDELGSLSLTYEEVDNDGNPIPGGRSGTATATPKWSEAAQGYECTFDLGKLTELPSQKLRIKLDDPTRSYPTVPFWEGFREACEKCSCEKDGRPGRCTFVFGFMDGNRVVGAVDIGQSELDYGGWGPFGGPVVRIAVYCECAVESVAAPLDPPANVSATPKPGPTGYPPQVTVSWDPVSDAIQYDVFKSSSSSPGPTQVATIPAPVESTARVTWVDDTVLPNADYTYYVIAIDQELLESRPSSTYQVRTPPITEPLPPTTVTVVWNGGTLPSLRMAWVDGSSDEAGFVVERRDGSAMQYERVATLGADTTSYEDSAVLENQTYEYRVAAIAGQAVSAWASSAPITTPYLCPAAPGNVSATATSSTSVQVAWQDNSGNETGFELYRMLDGQSSYVKLTSLSANVTAYLDTTLSENQGASYQVAACRYGSCSTAVTSSRVVTPYACSPWVRTDKSEYTVGDPIIITFQLCTRSSVTMIDHTPDGRSRPIGGSMLDGGIHSTSAVISEPIGTERIELQIAPTNGGASTSVSASFIVTKGASSGVPAAIRECLDRNFSNGLVSGGLDPNCAIVLDPSVDVARAQHDPVYFATVFAGAIYELLESPCSSITSDGRNCLRLLASFLREAAARGQRDAIKEFMDKYATPTTTPRTPASLGLTCANAMGVGPVAVAVAFGKAAQQYGIQVGDIILRIDGTQVTSCTDIGTILGGHSSGDAMVFTIRRGSQMLTIRVILD